VVVNRHSNDPLVPIGWVACPHSRHRVTVSAVLGQLAAGTSIDKLQADYPYLDTRMSSPRSSTQRPLRRSASWQL
jgi:hypothetical protein